MFARATVEECKIWKNILQVYEAASGQKINLQKSEISFSRNVPEEQRVKIKHELGVQAVQQYDKYLGLPTAVGRSKKVIFGLIKERVWRKLQGWKAKLLSRAGKASLIKAVAQAIPTYAMSVFKLPVGFCQDIQMMLARFWWGQQDKERKVHWVNWDKLCRRKEDGGMGFRDLVLFNYSMLGKQVWRLMTEPKSLLFQIWKARYFPRNDILQASLGHCPSYAWRSVWEARWVVNAGSFWSVGNGKSVRIWQDRWLPRPLTFKPITPCPVGREDDFVHSLLDPDLRKWDTNKVKGLLLNIDTDVILSLYIDGRWPEDKVTWFFEKDGCYSVKSAYRLLRELKGRTDANGSTNDQAMQWLKLWKAITMPRCILCMWAACLDILPTTGRLARKGISIDPSCCVCDREETALHVMKDCHFARAVWYDSPMEWVAEVEVASVMDWFITVQSLDPYGLAWFVTCAWALWWRRNDCACNNKCRLPGEILNYVTHVVDLKWENKHIKGQAKAREGWKAPSGEVIKINTDAGLMGHNCWGLGAVGRDDLGMVVAAGRRRMDQAMTPTEAEACAIVYGLQMAKDNGYEKLIVESDCLVVIQMLQKKNCPRSRIGFIIEEAHFLCSSFRFVQWHFVYRSGNKVANYLAHLPNANPEVRWVDNIPMDVMELALADVTDIT